MAHRNRIEKLIKHLQRLPTYKLNMDLFAYFPLGDHHTLTNLLRPNSNAKVCIAGLLALTPEFKEAGGERVHSWPVFNDKHCEFAVAEYLDITIQQAEYLTDPRFYRNIEIKDHKKEALSRLRHLRAY